MKILLLGDVHGRIMFLNDVINNSKKLNVDMVIQVGDFGFFDHVFREFFDSQSTYCNKKYRVPVYVIDGNHEDHKWLHKQDKDLWKELFNLYFIERGKVLKIGNSIIGFLGGALNIDRPQTTMVRNGGNLYDSEGIHNFTLNSEKDTLIKSLGLFDSKIDLMVTHTCPHSIGVNMRKLDCLSKMEEQYVSSQGVYTGDNYDCGEQVLTDLWNDFIFKPKNWVFGHFHRRYQTQVKNTLFTCLGSVDTSDNRNEVLPFVYDTESKTVEAFPNLLL